ncbi:MAG: DMT family transporter [Pseudoflavonifractor sp.]|nr:DMT family transporter [Alloprevotella sp.]MCM1116662.1 DMT family transporter [Pseudoflavonifractor sp.]
MSHNSNSKSSYPSFLIHLGGLIAVSAWGTSFVATKVLIQEGLNAVEIYIYRFIIAYLLTFIFCPKPIFSHNKRDELMFLLCGICGGSVYFISENTAVMYTLVSNVALITALAPLMTSILAALVFRSERLSRGFMLGSFVALIGVGFVIFNSSVEVNVNPFGDMLALLSAICWAIYTILLRPLNATYSAWFITRKTFFYGIITALPFLLTEPTHASLETLTHIPVMINLLFLGLVCSFLAYLLWSFIVKRIGAIKSGNYLYFSPIVTLVMSAIILGDRITAVGVIGCVLILGGVILSEKLGCHGHTHIKR